MRSLTERQLAAISAGLRLRQAEMQCGSGDSTNIGAYITAAELDQIATGGGQFNALDVDEIDVLCDSLRACSRSCEVEEDIPAMKDTLQDAVDYLAEAFEEAIDTEALVEWLSEWRQQAKRALSYAETEISAEEPPESGDSPARLSQ